MAFNIRKYLGIDGTPSVIAHDNNLNPIPDDLLNKLDKDINELISYIVGAKTAEPSKPPTTVKEYTESLDKFVTDSGLESFFPPDHPLPKEIAKKAVGLLNDPNAILNSPEQLEVRAKAALYDVVLYCDDSYSMTIDNRIQSQKVFASRVCNVILPLASGGISLRFINDSGAYDGLNSPEEVGNIIQRVAYNQYTQIGTMMDSKILEPLVYQKLRTKTLVKPLLILVITDGWPYNEPEDHFRNMILKSKEELKKNKKGKKAIIYQVNQIGNDPHSAEFIKGIFDDPELKETVHCTSEKLDEKIAELKDNEKGLNQWLYDLLFTYVKPTKPRKPKV